jgi:hypothetical protein
MERIPTASIAQIKRGLNPGFSYVFIENLLNPGTASDFDCVADCLQAVPGGVRDRTLYRSTDNGRLLLVISLDPGGFEDLKERMLASKLPGHLTATLYGSR